MLTLAELLCDAGFLITFVNSDYNHDRLERVMDIPAFYNRSPGFRFVSISDGLPLDQPRLGPIIFQLFFNTRTVSKPLFRELLISLRQSTERSPPTCIIADGLMCFAIDVAEELGVPIITFPTHGSHGMWTIMHTSNLIEEGEVPFQGKWTLVFLIPPICNIYNNRTVFSDGAVRWLGGQWFPRFKKKKKIIICIYIFWILLTFRSKIITLGPPLSQNLQIDP